MSDPVAGDLYSNITNKSEAAARGLIVSYFKDWSPDLEFITKLVQALPKAELEKLVNDKHLKLLSGLNKDERIVLD